MKAFSNGKLNDHISVAGNPIYPAYVIKGKEKSLMIDAGINLFGPLYVKSLTEILGNYKSLDYLFVTHSHYDHLGTVQYLKNKIPKLKSAGFSSINSLLKKESVIDWMNRFSDIQRPMFKDIIGDEDLTISNFSLDIDLKEGDTFDLGGLTCQVFETPGHTKDSLTFYIPEIKAIFPGEVIGVPDWKKGDIIQVEFLSSYDDYLNSMKMIQELKPQFIGTAHGWYFTDDDADKYLTESIKETEKYRKLIEMHIDDSNGDLELAIESIARDEYDDKDYIMQERSAYIANLTAQVKHIISLR